MKTLRDHADRLVDVLWTVCSALDAYSADDRAAYARELAARLRPMVQAFADAVRRERSRIRAQEILTEIGPIMDEVNGAATKGDMALSEDSTLDLFWDLSTLFREARFCGESL